MQSQASVARELEVTSAAVSKWHTAWKNGGLNALSAKPHPGPGKSITAHDQQRLLEAVNLGAAHWGFTINRWTGERLADVCQRVTGVNYHPSHLRRLMREFGYSPQKPQKKALERDEEAIAVWLEQTHAELVKKGRRMARRSSTATRLARV
jgi:transposase